MKTSQKGLDLIAKWEGLKLEPYYCPAKIPTIGIGSTRYADGRPVAMDDPPITEKEAMDLFKTTLARYEQAVERSVTGPVEQHEFDAMVSLCYNIGIGAFSKSTLVKLYNKKNKFAAAAQFLMWNKAGGVVLKGLVNRRQEEKRMFEGF